MNTITQPLQIIFLALLGGQLLFAGVVYYLLQGATPAPDKQFFGYFVPLFLLLCGGLAFWINNRRLEQMQQLPDAATRTEFYRSTVILRLALVEGANLFAIIAALVAENKGLLLNFLIGLLVFLYFRPKKEEEEG